MSKHRALVYGQPVPQDFFDALQEFLGTMGSPNLDLTMVPGSQNQIQIVAGTGSAQVGLAIDGLWRYISATTQTTVGGGSGTYDVFVTTGNNSFATNPTPPPPEIDSTDYTFALVTPLLQGNVPGAAHYRKVGEVIFDGSRILSLRQTIDIDTSQGFQPGDIKMSAVANPPAGWLACQGQEVSRTTYAALFAALGGLTSPWGLGVAGSGGPNFNVPDLKSRAPIGAGQGSGLSNRALGSHSSTTNGEETHTLGLGEIPAHDHGGSTSTGDGVGRASMTGAQNQLHTHGGTTGNDNADHTHGQPGGNTNSVIFGADSSGNLSLAGGTAFHGQSGLNTGGRSAVHQHGFTTGTESVWHWHGLASVGLSGAHNNMPPWVATNYFIKT